MRQLISIKKMQELDLTTKGYEELVVYCIKLVRQIKNPFTRYATANTMWKAFAEAASYAGERVTQFCLKKNIGLNLEHFQDKETGLWYSLSYESGGFDYASNDTDIFGKSAGYNKALKKCNEIKPKMKAAEKDLKDAKRKIEDAHKQELKPLAPRWWINFFRKEIAAPVIGQDLMEEDEDATNVEVTN